MARPRFELGTQGFSVRLDIFFQNSASHLITYIYSTYVRFHQLQKTQKPLKNHPKTSKSGG